ncbi:adenosine receptor A2b [Perca fluviatilis]|uniref:adenosine receptor A2b n=1 Tax=Perca fluviatilis TaxID=8168 RepID=UPI001964D2C0|nr:adenosine receptor A2b [Perca fluviatilis]
MADGVRTLYGALMLVSGAACVCGNVLLLLLLLLNAALRSDTLSLALSAAVSDLALGLATVPFAAYHSLAWPTRDPGDGAVCQGSGFLFLLLQTSSLHSLAWTAADRFSEIWLALSHGAVWTAWRRRGVLLAVWAFSVATAALPLLGFGAYEYSQQRSLCGLSFTPENGNMVAAWAAVAVAAPILAACGLNGYVVYVARKQARRGTFTCNELHCYYVPANNYLRSSVVMVTTSVCLLVCWLPYISVGLYETFSGQESPAVTAALSTWLVLTSAALNPWITCLTQTRYRAAVRPSIRRFIQMCLCSGTALESRPQISAPHLDSANRISMTMTTATRPKTPT